MNLLPRLRNRQTPPAKNQMISKVAAILCQESAANFFAPIVNWITFTRGLLGQGRLHRMAQADFNIRGLARSLGVILRWRPCFLCPAR